MSLTAVLSIDRVSVAGELEGEVRTKGEALHRLSAMLASGAAPIAEARIFAVLSEREALQSTGIGGGVAVPHGAVEELDHQVGAVLVCPGGIAFDAIDGEPVSLIFALVGPKGAPAEHLKILARMSRLLRKPSFRHELSTSPRGVDAFALIEAVESQTG